MDVNGTSFLVSDSGLADLNQGTRPVFQALAFTPTPNIQSSLKPVAASSITSDSIINIIFGIAALVATILAPLLLRCWTLRKCKWNAVTLKELVLNLAQAGELQTFKAATPSWR
jgi:hypothetical protein